MTASVGESVKLACVDQSRTLDPNKTLIEEITGGGDVVLGSREMNSRAYVARFNFSGTDQQKKSAPCPVASAIACISRKC